jgi:hypothetical protein
VKFFAESLAEYMRQHEETTKIVENMSVGMLLCDASKLKTNMLPSPMTGCRNWHGRRTML